MIGKIEANLVAKCVFRIHLDASRETTRGSSSRAHPRPPRRLTVLRRLDCVLAKTKQKVLDTQAKLKGKAGDLEPQLLKATGFDFYNTSSYDFDKLLDDARHLASNLGNYINGFGPNMRENETLANGPEEVRTL